MKKFCLWTILVLFISWVFYGFLRELAFYTDEFFKSISKFLAVVGWIAIALGVGWFCEYAFPSEGKYGLIGFFFVLIGLPVILVILIVIAHNIFF